MKESNLIKYTCVFLLLVLTIGSLYVGGFIIFPLLFAVFSSLALLPIVNFLQKLKFNHLFSCLATVLLVSFVLVGAFVYISLESYDVINELSLDKEVQPSSLIENLKDQAIHKAGMTKTEGVKTMESIKESAVQSSGVLISALLNTIQSALFFLSIVPIYIFFMLYYRGHVKKYLIAKFNAEEKTEHFKVIDETKTMIQKYLFGLTIVIGIVSTLNSIGLLCLGIKHAIFIGITTGILIIIPYIGVFIGALIPISLALVTKDNIWYAAGVLMVYTVVQFLEGNYITPNIIGDSVNLNPLVIIVGMIVFGAIGGILAMIIAIPLLATIKIYLDHSKSSHLSILLSNK